nr:MAG TPA: DNA polymerase III subunit alpha [Caudoviricetes sp.]
MGGLILIVIIFAVWYYRHNKKKKQEAELEAEAPFYSEFLDAYRLPESNGFARVSLPVANKYKVPIDSFVAFDVETANAQPYSICSISAVKVENGKIVDSITSLIKPPEIKFTNTRIHGITWEMVRTAPTFKEFYESAFHDFIKGYVLVAHNAQFDMGCLLHTAKTEGIVLDIPLLFADTLQSARYAYRELPNHKLDTICKHLNISLDHHDSLSDARACALIMLNIMERKIPPIVKSLFGPSKDMFVKTVIYEAEVYAGGISYEDLYSEKPDGYTKEDFIRDFVDPGNYAHLVDISIEKELKKLHKPELQKILADAGLPTKGLKKDLIATIIEKGIAPALPENYIHVYKVRDQEE